MTRLISRLWPGLGLGVGRSTAGGQRYTGMFRYDDAIQYGE